MKLVITEKERMAFNIARALGKYARKRIGLIYFYQVGEFSILPLKGHITNYITRKDISYWTYSSVDKILHDPFSIVKVMSAKGYYSAIRTLAEKSEEIIIATDPDEEGENIGLEIIEILEGLHKPIKRLWLTTTIQSDIIKAFSNLRSFNKNLALSVEARRKIDSITGFAGTRELTLRLKVGKNVMSFGRVQTSTLWIIVQREREINSFVSKPYWEIIADVEGTKFTHVSSPFFDKEKAEQIFSKAKGSKVMSCSNITKNVEEIRPPRPLNTADMLKVATGLMHISPSRVMSLAEKLYLYGRITYPRVENQTYTSSFNHRANLGRLQATSLADYVKSLMARDILQPSKGRYHEDHEPITPIAPITEVNDLHLRRLYEIILRHYLSIFGPPAKLLNTKVEGVINEELFTAEGKEVLEPGFYKVYYYSVREKKLSREFRKNMDYSVNSIDIVEKKTEPPPRFTLQSLLAEMEKLGIGTKSTRPQMIDILRRRKYIDVKGMIVYPTVTGLKLIEYIGDRWMDYISPEFTARVEEEMRKISEGKKDWMELVEDERKNFSNAIQRIRQNTD
ncbi:MAG: type IA DNA topoisomerase [Nitrososphaerota archaeon]